MAVNPTGPALREFLDTAPDEPFVMLNLLRFVDGGRRSYARYSAAVSKILARYGGEVIYFGSGLPALVAEPGQEWDAVLLVRYPSPQAFSQMVADAEYQQFTHLRTEALREAVLQPTRPLG